jgi:hypothetical protein
MALSFSLQIHNRNQNRITIHCSSVLHLLSEHFGSFFSFFFSRFLLAKNKKTTLSMHFSAKFIALATIALSAVSAAPVISGTETKGMFTVVINSHVPDQTDLVESVVAPVAPVAPTDETTPDNMRQSLSGQNLREDDPGFPVRFDISTIVFIDVEGNVISIMDENNGAILSAVDGSVIAVHPSALYNDSFPLGRVTLVMATDDARKREEFEKKEEEKENKRIQKENKRIHDLKARIVEIESSTKAINWDSVPMNVGFFYILRQRVLNRFWL